MTSEFKTERLPVGPNFDPAIMGRLEMEWLKDALTSEFSILYRDHTREVEGLMHQFGLNERDATKAIGHRLSGNMGSLGFFDFLGKKDMESYYKILSEQGGLRFNYKLAIEADRDFRQVLKKKGLYNLDGRDALCKLFSIIYGVSEKSLRPAMDSRIEAFKNARLASKEESINERLALWQKVETELVQYYRHLRGTMAPDFV